MTYTQFRAALERLGLTQADAARLVGVDDRTARRWWRDEVTIPKAIAILFRLLLAGKITIDDIEKAVRQK